MVQRKSFERQSLTEQKRKGWLFMKSLLSMIALMAVLAFATSAQAQSQGNEKVCIEHKGKYISVSVKAADAHVKHGDTPVDASLCASDEDSDEDSDEGAEEGSEETTVE